MWQGNTFPLRARDHDMWKFTFVTAKIINDFTLNFYINILLKLIVFHCSDGNLCESVGDIYAPILPGTPSYALLEDM